MFEQNCNTGYVLKPSVLWDKQHPEYGRFNPFEKKKENEYTVFQLKIISGQYLTENTLVTNNTNTYSGYSGSYASASNSNNNSASNNVNNNNGIINNNVANGNSTANSMNSSNYHQHRNNSVEILQTSSTFIEIEILGIQCDCAKEKTKTFNKNALNPIWNEEFTFHVTKIDSFLTIFVGLLIILINFRLCFLI